ncbi:hypothetical protein GCM10023069_00270 [Shinella granuli]
MPDYLYFKDRNSRFVVANRAIVNDNRREGLESLEGLSDFDIHPEHVARGFFETEQEIIRTGRAMLGRCSPRAGSRAGLLNRTSRPRRARTKYRSRYAGREYNGGVDRSTTAEHRTLRHDRRAPGKAGLFLGLVVIE